MKGKLYIKLGIALSAVMILMASCYEDKGNYDYTPINQIVFEDLEDVYTIAYGEPITIKPTLIQTATGSEENYEYAWLNLGTGGEKVIDTVHKEKFIEDVFLDKLKIGANKLIYQVRDVARNITYSSQYFTIEVGNDIKQGFMLLLNDGGKTDLRFLNYSPSYNGGTNIEMRSVSLASLPELGAPVGIACYHDYHSPSAGGSGYLANGNKSTIIYAVSLVTETGLYRLNPADHRYEDIFHGKYVITGNWDNLHIAGIYTPSNRTYTTSAMAMLKTTDGNYMFYRSGAGAALTIIPWSVGAHCNRYRNADETYTKDFRAFKDFGFLMNWTAVFYDMDSRSFVFKGAADNFCTRFTADETLFKFNNNDASFEPLWLYTRASDTYIDGSYLNTTFSLVKNTNTGSINMLMFGSANTATSPQKVLKMWPQTDAGKTLLEFNNAKRYALHAAGNNVSYRSLFYYATDTEIFVYDLSDGTNKKVFPLEGDETGRTIVDMQFIIQQQITGNNAFQNNFYVVTKGAGENSTSVGIYVVAVNDGALSLRELSNNDGKVLCKWENLPDYVGMDWKAKP